jgi:PAS domain S-box-containing protein
MLAHKVQVKSMERHRAIAVEDQRALYEKIPAMLYAVDEGGKLVEVSDQCLQRLGYSRAEVVGRSSWDFLTDASRQRLQPLYQSVLRETGQLRDAECEFVTKTGEIVPLLLSVTAERNQQGEIGRLLAVLTDAQQRTQAQRMLREILEGTAAYTGGDFFRSLVSHVAQAFQVCYAMITECTDHTLTRVRTLACYKYHNFLEQFEYDLAGGPCQGVIEGGVCHYPRLRELFPREDQFSYLGVPIHDSRGNVLGHLVVEDDKPMQPGPYDVEILKLFAARAGAELERKRAEVALREREQQLQALNERLVDTNRSLEAMVAARTHEIEQRRQVAESLRDMVMILNSERPLTEILTYVVAAATRLLGADAGAIYTLQPDQTLTMRARQGWSAVEHTVLAQAVARRHPVVIAQPLTLATPQPPGEEQAPSSPPPTTQTLLAVPLLRPDPDGATGEVYGGIALEYHTPRQFADEEIALAGAFGAQAALAIENARLRQRVEQAAILEERSRLARELHDSVTQQLYSLTLMAEGWRRMVQRGRYDGVDEALAEVGQLGQQALKELRLLIYELHPPDLQEDGLLAALHGRLAAVERRSGVEARLIATDALDLPAPLEATLYRIALEALNNTLKHAGATAVTLGLRVSDGQVILEVTDNGCGFDPSNANTGGLGLSSMRERAERVGGILTLCSAVGQGTTVRVVLPSGVPNDE